MKLTIIFILTVGLLSCNNSVDKKTVDNETAKDRFVHIDTFFIDQNEVNESMLKKVFL